MNKITNKLIQLNPEQVKLHFRRFELKYLINPHDYPAVKSQISARLQLDPFTHKTGSYQVSSIYLDTPTLSTYSQTKAGIKNRTKYRLRSYSNSLNQPSYMFWEIKRKNDMVVVKDRSILSTSESIKLFYRDNLPSKISSTLKEFIFFKRRYLLKPKILIRYRREPYICDSPELRITFDTNIEVATIDDLTDPVISSRLIFPQAIVMEFKFTGSLPFWLGEIVRQYNLERQPFSKYTHGIEKTKSYLPWIIS